MFRQALRVLRFLRLLRIFRAARLMKKLASARKAAISWTRPSRYSTMSHNEVLALYKEIVDPDFWYANFSEADQAKILKAGRCNNNLATAKLEAAAGVPVPHVRESMRGVFLRMRDSLKNEGEFPPAPRKGPKPSDVSTF